ncbi:DUF4352 domain-containing protein [Desemzia sp. C1]|uniref:DUF4352 domain-containing protein n=1 Tax=Desemzia sp. C1 TaxID=2892016 RepID=UPI001E4580C8|nr:DUF4352 domain-containing protein [Desemzia sp. C1]MCI3027733.1 DUF4352 domain-containing protein [Desemzia sp. C1]
MSKKITDDQGNVYVQKKPFYKKWWVWLLLALLVFYFIGSSVPDERDNSDNETTETETNADASSVPVEEAGSNSVNSEESVEIEQAETYDVGEQAIFSDSSTGDEIAITVNSVSLDSGDEYNVPTGDHYVKADITFENKGSNVYLANASEFSIYDSNGSKGETSSKDFILEEIAAGKNFSGPVYFDVVGSGPYEIQIYDTTWVVNPK